MAILREIVSIQYQYQECSFCILGREDNQYFGASGFDIVQVQPCDYESVRLLIDKYPFHEETKQNFLEKFTRKFFKENQAYLETPLLSLMMLMTFSQYPEKTKLMSKFYSNVFHTLVTWHDATKDSFYRDKNINSDTFTYFFSVFSLISYLDNSLKMDAVEIDKIISRSIDYIEKIGIINYKNKFDSQDAREDLCQGTNLIIKDGIHYEFIHRSLQEYFFSILLPANCQ